MQYDKNRKFSLFLSARFNWRNKNSKIVCFKCFEDQHLVNFFVEGAGLSQHFRTMHRNCDVDMAKCKAIFQEHHAKETANAVQRLNTRRLQSVSEFSFNSYQGNCEYVSSNLKFTAYLRCIYLLFYGVNKCFPAIPLALFFTGVLVAGWYSASSHTLTLLRDRK